MRNLAESLTLIETSLYGLSRNNLLHFEPQEFSRSTSQPVWKCFCVLILRPDGIMIYACLNPPEGWQDHGIIWSFQKRNWKFQVNFWIVTFMQSVFRVSSSARILLSPQALESCFLLFTCQILAGERPFLVLLRTRDMILGSRWVLQAAFQNLQLQI